jgi:hypothetical protein
MPSPESPQPTSVFPPQLSVVPIEPTDEYMNDLHTMLLEVDEMGSEGYLISELSPRAIDTRLAKKKDKCRNCFQGTTRSSSPFLFSVVRANNTGSLPHCIRQHQHSR